MKHPHGNAPHSPMNRMEDPMRRTSARSTKSRAGQTGGSVSNPPYGYPLDPAGNVKSTVMGGSGVGHI
jgi:pectate lyase